MRFYFGFGKRISLKSLFKWGALIIGGLFAFFGINNITALAGTLESFQYFSNCNYQTTNYNSSNCTQLSGNVVTKTNMNGLANVFTPTGYYSQNYAFSQTASQRSSLFKWEGVSSNTPCSTNGTLSYYVDVIMGDKNNSFARNVLDPNNTQPNNPNPPIITSMREGVKRIMASSSCTSTWCYYWSWLSSTNTNTDNQTGVRTIKADGSSLSNCTYISRDDTHRSARFRCSVSTTGNGGTGHVLIVDQYNNGYDGLTAQNYNNTGLYAPIGIKVTKIEDPCSSDDNSITSSITDQTNEIIQGFSDIQSDLNDFKNNNHQDIEDLKDKADALEGVLDDISDKQDDTNDKLDDIKDGIDQSNKNTESCTISTYGRTHNIYNNNIGVFNSDGSISSSEINWRYTDYIKTGNNSNLILQINYIYNSGKYCLYDFNKNLIGSCISYSGVSSINIPLSNNVYYIRFNYNIIPSPDNVNFKKCSGIGQTLTDSDINLNSDVFNNINQIPDTPITNLLQMPITLGRKIYDSISVTSCSDYSINIGLPNNHNVPLTFPCMDYDNTIGSNGKNLLDGILCIGLAYGIAMACIRFYERWSSLHDTFDDLYKGGGH